MVRNKKGAEEKEVNLGAAAMKKYMPLANLDGVSMQQYTTQV